MILTINNGVLEKCVLEKNEKTVYIPDTVKEIAQNAFADNPEGKIEGIHFSDSLEHIHVHAFRGLGVLKYINAFSYGPLEDMVFAEENGERKGRQDLDPRLTCETLVITESKKGRHFILESWLDQLPDHIYVFAKADFRQFYSVGVPKAREGFHMKSFNIYGSGDELSEKNIMERFATARSAEKVRLINRRLIGLDETESERVAHDANPEMSLRKSRAEIQWRNTEYNWKWAPVNREGEPFGFTDMTAAREIVLPEGLEVIHNDIIRCESLRKLVIPAEVEYICGSIRHCPSLSSVWVNMRHDYNLFVDGSSFLDCPKLKTITLYEENPFTGTIKAAQRVPKARWLKYHFLETVLTEAAEKFPRLLKRMDYMPEARVRISRQKTIYDQMTDRKNVFIGLIRSAVTSDSGYTAEEIYELRGYLNRIDIILRSRDFE